MDDPKLMRLFMAIADRGSLSGVARAWGMAPSTVTHGLKQLEDRLGTQLVLRTTRQLSLTPEGERFLGDCRRILADLDEVMTGFSEQGPLAGEIRITATNDLGRLRIAPLIDRFMEAHPDLRIQLFLSDTVVDLVDAGFDVGIRTGPLRDSDLKARLLLRGSKRVCAAPGYWRRRGKPSHPRELTSHNCLVLSSPGDSQAFWSFRDGANRFRVRVAGDRTVNDGQAVKDWAIAGAGVAMKSVFDVADDIAAGRLETALESYTAEPTNLYAVFPPRGRESRRVRALLDYLGEQLASTEE
ncbi:LysR family transcriptional regulator [Methyloligella sp. 2.7D]|uniref:LysR family transcriptional regulator n=1 Tax=unclassified Methyloligella TaxID=2625955 RepID=UPI00157C7CCC|nr:LysR family transcriptional regulator [Methyloligella sp. GL2]QKP77638.1 LysR family transcriptional regulator [Methyloligella sp. GL2]